MVRRNEANRVMDELAALGAKAILTTDIRSCRALKANGDDGPASSASSAARGDGASAGQPG